MKIISGGQTGADQGALEGASDAGIETGGFTVEGFLTEKGKNPALRKFGLVPCCIDYPSRTEINVAVSDYTIWFGKGDSAGYLATKRSCKQWDKVMFTIDKFDDEIAVIDLVSHLFKTYQSNVVNIAGNRESKSPGIQEKVRRIIRNSIYLSKSVLPVKQ